MADSKPLFDYLDKKQQVRGIAACTNTNGSRQPLCNAPSLVHESIGAQANVRLEKPPSRSAEDKLRDLIAQDHGAMPARTHSLAHAHSPSPFTVHRSPFTVHRVFSRAAMFGGGQKAKFTPEEKVQAEKYERMLQVTAR